MKPESEEIIPSRHRSVWSRRAALATAGGAGVGCWLWWKTGRSAHSTIELDYSVLENLPGGWVEVRLPHDLLINELAIEVRRTGSGFSRVTDMAQPEATQDKVILQMDLPGTKWEAGSYEARLLVQQESFGRLKVRVERSTPWFPAFALRGAIWFG